MTDAAKKMPLLETRGLKKTFGTLEVLKGVDMHISTARRWAWCFSSSMCSRT